MSKALLILPPASWDYAITLLQKILPKRLNQRNPAEKLQKLARVLASKSPEEMYLHLVSSWDDPTSVVRGADGHQTVLTDRQQWASLAEFSQSMMYLDAMTYLTSDILVKLDRAAMAVALETRTPLLDHRVAAFAWRLPTELKIRNGQGKWLMRQVLYRYVPKKLVERPKSGFAIPIHAWIRGELRDWADALLDEQRLRREGFFYPDPIRQKWSEHLSGRRNWVDPLWNVIMFQAWFEYQHRTAPQHAICSVPAV